MALGRAAGEPPAAPPLDPLDFPTQRLSPSEVDYPAIVEMHRASSLDSGAQAATWRAASEGVERARGLTPGADLVPLAPPRTPATGSIEEVIVRRGSARRFTPDPIDFGELSTVLDAATQGTPSDVAAAAARRPDGLPLTELYLIVNAVEGLPSGAYALDRARRALLPLKPGQFRQEAGYLALGQELAADAAVNVYHLADLRAILPRLGNRGTAPRSWRRRSRAASSTSPPTRSASVPLASPSSTTT